VPTSFTVSVVDTTAPVIAAHADVTVTLTKQYFTPRPIIDHPEKATPADIPKTFIYGTLVRETIYLHDKLERHDYGRQSRFFDHQADTVTTVDWAHKEFSVSTIEDLAQTEQLMIDPDGILDITPKRVTGDRTLNGHRLVHYKSRNEFIDHPIFDDHKPVKKVHLTDLWAAPDLPAANLPASTYLYGMLSLDHYHNVPGLILSINISDSTGESLTIKAVDLSTKHIPLSTFQPPIDFHEVGDVGIE